MSALRTPSCGATFFRFYSAAGYRGDNLTTPMIISEPNPFCGRVQLRCFFGPRRAPTRAGSPVGKSVAIGPHKRPCHREGFSVHVSIASYQNEARSGLYAMRPWQEPAPDLGSTALGSREPIGRSAPTRKDHIAAVLKTKPSRSSHNRWPSPGESIQGRAPFESSVHCT
jgi:hypothetical protein